jgi:RNA 2',3'-cyclic 3'-phosphodiesterase
VTRTFVALWIPSDWTEYLSGVSRSLTSHASGLSWVRPENLHITIRFLGDLDEAAVRRACESVTRSAAGAIASRARLGALGAFPNFARARVVWVGLAEGGGDVSRLAGRVNEALERDGFGPPDKPFRAHLTLARVREGARGLAAIRDAVLPDPPAAGLLDRVAVMKSELHPTGARYTALADLRLRPASG